jgi:ribosome biogenesis GTPase
MTLEKLGWSDFFGQIFSSEHTGPGLMAARVWRTSKQIYHVLCEEGSFVARVSGNFRHRARISSDYPAVGDWVVVRLKAGGMEAEIRELLPRQTVFSRQAVSASGTESKSSEQVIAANVDVAFLIASLDAGRGFSLRRLERYLTLTRNSGARPVVVLNKADLAEDAESAAGKAREIASGAPVHTVSAIEEDGVASLRQYVSEAVTLVLLGASGSGKSTIINSIAGIDIMRTSAVRQTDARGRHTTTWSELTVLEGGGILIDTPGLRDVQLWSGETAVEETFAELQEIARGCRFRDCKHSGEPGCAVAGAIESGKIEKNRLISFKKQKEEIAAAMRRRDHGEKLKHLKPLRPRRKKK